MKLELIYGDYFQCALISLGALYLLSLKRSILEVCCERGLVFEEDAERIKDEISHNITHINKAIPKLKPK